MEEETQPTTGAAPESTEAVAPPPVEEAAAGDGTPEAAPPPSPDWRTLIRDVPPEEILKEHEALRKHTDGRAGQMARRLATERYLPEALATERESLRKEVEAEVAARRTEEERQRRLGALGDLIEEDPARAARELREIQAQEKTEKERETEAGRLTELVGGAVSKTEGDYDQTVFYPLFRLLSPEDQQALRGKDYGQGPRARLAYVADIVALRDVRVAKAAVAKARGEWEKGIEPRITKATEAGRKEALGDVNGGVDVDTGGGGGAPGEMNLQQYLALPTEERTRLKREEPQKVDAMTRRAMNGRR